MNPGAQSKPSPIVDGWLLVAAIRPSTLEEEYPSEIDGAGPPSDGGSRIGYVQEKSPEFPPADQVADGDSVVAV
jgi:hypothetical protein